MEKFKLSLTEKEKLADELIKNNSEATVGDYLKEVQSIETELNQIQ